MGGDIDAVAFGEPFARSLIEKGQLYFRSLAYFRGYEDELVRGDPDDGKLRYQPEQGLTLTKSDGQIVTLPSEWRFRASGCPPLEFRARAWLWAAAE
jgi:hypothetical protein